MQLNWTSRVVKYVLFIFNLLFVISGIIMIGVGVSVKSVYNQYDIFLDSKYFSLPNLLIATGALIFFISFFGCCGAIKESWLMIFIFSVLLSLIFILEFSAGIAGYVLRDQTASYLKTELRETLPRYKVGDPKNSTTKMWDLIQNKFSCCGVHNASDWDLNTEIPPNSLPASCCTSNVGAVGKIECSLVNNDTATFYHKGCVKGFGDFLKENAVTLGGVGMAIAVIQLFGVVFACYLTRQIKQGYYTA